MNSRDRPEIEELINQIEETWSLLDQLFDVVDAQNAWNSKHGEDWTFADLPFHLAYCDRELLIKVIEAGRDLPPEEQWEARTLRDVDAWNEARFGERPPDQTVDQSIEQMHTERQTARSLLAKMSDEDLDKPAWFPLAWRRGWRTIRTPLEFCRDHNWLEFQQLRILMNQNRPIPSEGLTHEVLDSFLHYQLSSPSSQKADGVSFKMVWDIEGPGGGTWTFRVENSARSLMEGRIENPDLEMTFSIETFVKLGTQTLNPLVSLLKRQIKVRGWLNMGKFAKLFPMPGPNQVIEPVPYF